MTVVKKNEQLLELPAYRIEGELGDGGMATVYRGTQLSLQRPVAIKVLKHQLADDPSIRARFEKESLIIARLNHPNIIHVIDQGLTAEDMPYFVMEYAKSIDLEQAMKQGGVSTNRILDIFIQISKALAYAHKNRVIHRDIKPANILVDYEGNVRVLDFGIAHFYGDEGSVHNTGKGDVMGTYAYMAPEQRESADAVGPRSDLYSLGVMMYQFFTGQLPQGRYSDPAQLNSKMLPALNSLILQCLEEDPDKRPASADEIKNKLLMILQGGHLGAEQRKRAAQSVKKDFALLDVIKEDRHGAVYLVEEKNSHSFLVLKKKPRQSKGYQQAQQLAQISHSNLIKILGTSQNDRVYILAMEYLSGGSLSDRLTQAFRLDNYYPIAIQIADGMAAAQSAGIVHGNLRPTNILFGETGQVKISDFGLDEHYTDQEEHNWYQPAEEEMSAAGDIYAAGIIFYQMLIGERPKRKHLRLVSSKQFEKLPAELQRMVKDMLSLDAKKRPSHFIEVAQTLREVCGDQATVIVRPKKTKINIKQGVEEKEKSKKGGIRLLLLLLLFLSLQGYLLTTGRLQELINNFFQLF